MSYQLRLYFAFLFSFFISNLQAANTACEIVPRYGQARLLNGTLTPFWAQEYIGGALAQATISRYSSGGGFVEAPQIGVVEAGVALESLLGPVTESLKTELSEVNYPDSGHGNSVCNLINAPAPVGVGIGKLGAVVLYAGETANDAITKMLATRTKIVNISQRRHTGEWNEAAIRELSKKRILVWAAGNTFPKPVVEFPDAPDVIGVGSLTLWGTPSSYSQEGDGVHIMAPADYPLQMSYDHRYKGFGGTSGASPMVTGALSNVFAILQDLTAHEARRLLEKTAVPVASTFQVPPKNGAGMVNAVKLVESAIRLKRRGWPVNRAELIEDVTVYDFSSESAALLNEAKPAIADFDCLQRQQGFAKLQNAFLLSTGSPKMTSQKVFEEARQLLIRHLLDQGLSANAAFYRAFDRNELPNVLEERVPTAELEDRWSIERSLRLIPLASAVALLERSVTKPEVQTALNAVEILWEFPEGAIVARAAYRHPDVRVRRALVDRGCHGEIGKEVLKQALNDPDLEVRTIAEARLKGEGPKPKQAPRVEYDST